MDRPDEPDVSYEVEQLDTPRNPDDATQPEPRPEPKPDGNAPTNAESNAGPPTAASSRLNLDKIRELILLAHEDVVPEMVTGETFEELLASVEPARGAFQQVVERIVRSGSGTKLAGPDAAITPKAGPIPAGQPGRAATHDAQAANLNPSAKIAEGLRRRTG